MKKIVDLRAFVTRDGGKGADYHANDDDHWITGTRIATPMSKYPEYEQTRTSFGIDVLGTVMVEVEADDGTVGLLRYDRRRSRRLPNRKALQTLCGRPIGEQRGSDVRPDVPWIPFLRQERIDPKRHFRSRLRCMGFVWDA